MSSLTWINVVAPERRSVYYCQQPEKASKVRQLLRIAEDAEIGMNDNFSKSAKRGVTRRSRGNGREEAYGFKESRGYRYRLKNAVANFLKNLREHLHDVHSPG